jgi:hypothetical protein
MTLIVIFDKDEKTKDVLFMIECFDKDKRWASKAVERIIKEVHQIENYTTNDLKESLNKEFGIYPIIRYVKGEDNEVNFGF